ncbi:nicotinate-nucleotide adenylyltransferase [Thiohalophilus sp.]|uniref:nicotinate-nucleotide adenylyltransferase n=1 Tax=Thiohalophilus sp. TaxID=3028392 RepID=UPI002ACE5D26|nr:nicotinate-nucleotide adenylyltransferase [Thiohalophilus sp.]MDZ7662234.1 nicotinate-nucleotide adenylyltransferase [Thiohalophilus sp.]
MIGILGGTFDPIHFGHLRPALEIYQALGLRELRFIPSGEPPHRDKPQASALQRLMMVRAAIAGQPGFVIDDRELRRSGPSYMVDTLHSLREELGTSTPLCLVLGLDAFLGLEGWHRWQDLFDYTHLVITHRPGWSLRDMRTDSILAREIQTRYSEPEQLARQPAGKLAFQSVTQLDISASGIREELARGRDIRYLLPDTVHEFIKTQHIYG